MENLERKPLLLGALIAVLSSLLSTALTFWAIYNLALTTSRESEFMAMLLSLRNFYPQQYYFSAGLAGYLSYAVGYLIGPLLVGFVAAHFATERRHRHVLFFAIVIPAIWILGALLSLPASGLAVIFGSIALGAIMIVIGGWLATRKQEN